MFFRFIAFTVGLIAVVTGIRNYDDSATMASLPIITGGLVMLIAIFNVLPKIKHCPSCNKKIADRAETCRFCGHELDSGKQQSTDE
ncbi:MAG: zinc ribbon domain-containing protein [Thermodesulfobacteriota bacterium]